MSFFITRTPLRVSFFGGGTDYPEWYRVHDGAVLSTTIDKFCYINCRYLPPFFDIRHRIVWSHIETVNSIAEILHPAVREGLRQLGFTDERGIELHYQGDLPARAGMGSSSSFSVGLIKALKALRGEEIEGLDLARAAIELERDRLKEPVGVQDQTAAAIGGFNILRFSGDDEIEAEPVRADSERVAELTANLMLFFTGTSRLGATVTVDVIKNLSGHSSELRAMLRLVDRAAAIMENRQDLDEFGRLLGETWRLKRTLSDSITNNRIEALYAQAIGAGAIGGKLLGAGASGFMLFYVPPRKQAKVREALSSCLEVPFNFEPGACTIVHRPEDNLKTDAADG